jgi:hypothetical protein
MPVAGNGNVGDYYRRIEPLRKDYPLGGMLEVYSFKFCYSLERRAHSKTLERNEKH